MGVIPSEGSRTFLWQICTVTTDAPSPGASAFWWCRCGAESIGEKEINVYGPCVFSNRDTPIVKKKKGGDTLLLETQLSEAELMQGVGTPTRI